MCYLITIVYCRDWERVKGNRINVYFRIGKERKTMRLSVSHHHSQELGKRESKQSHLLPGLGKREKDNRIMCISSPQSDLSLGLGKIEGQLGYAPHNLSLIHISEPTRHQTTNSLKSTKSVLTQIYMKPNIHTNIKYFFF